MQIELRNHISQAQHPITREPLFDESGLPVPLFPDQRSIWIDGKMVGYVCSAPWHRISFIHRDSGENHYVRERVRQLVIDEFGVDPDQISNIPEFVEATSDEEDGD